MARCADEADLRGDSGRRDPARVRRAGEGTTPNGAVRFYSLANPAKPAKLSEAAAPGRVFEVALRNDLVFTAIYETDELAIWQDQPCP